MVAVAPEQQQCGPLNIIGYLPYQPFSLSYVTLAAHSCNVPSIMTVCDS